MDYEKSTMGSKATGPEGEDLVSCGSGGIFELHVHFEARRSLSGRVDIVVESPVKGYLFSQKMQETRNSETSYSQ